MDSLLTNLADELLVQDITKPSAVLGSLCDDELQAAYDHILEQFALELLIGAAKDSDWSNGKLVIDANRLHPSPPSCLLRREARSTAAEVGMVLKRKAENQLELIAPGAQRTGGRVLAFAARHADRSGEARPGAQSADGDSAVTLRSAATHI
jgi:hypothetical protein